MSATPASPSAAAASSAWAKPPSDRAGLIAALANLPKHPESVPINALVRVEGTPLATRPADRRARFRAHDRGGAHHHAARHGAALRRPRRHEPTRRRRCASSPAPTRSSTAPRLLTTANPAADRDHVLLTARHDAGLSDSEAKKYFFFEKKNQKTFSRWLRAWTARAPIRQKFFGSFFQKRTASVGLF